MILPARHISDVGETFPPFRAANDPLWLEQVARPLSSASVSVCLRLSSSAFSVNSFLDKGVDIHCV